MNQVSQAGLAVAQHCPEVDRIAMFAEHPEITTAWARRRWEPPTAYTLLQAVGNVLTDTPGTGLTCVGSPAACGARDRRF